MPVPAADGVLRFVHPQAFLLLWLLLPLAAAIVVAGRARRRDARRFRSVGERAAAASNARPLLAVLTLMGLAALVIAVARPGWEAQAATVERRGRDVVFVVDVSRSMLAEDLAPNRLERVKLAILDTVEVLSGDRVALVAFAGSAVVKSPLTFDYGFFRMAVQQLSVAGVSRGGSLIGDALRTVGDDVLDRRMREFKDVLLFTDGGDHDSFPVQAAEELGQGGVRVVAIGVGDDATGQPIPDPAHADAAAPAFIEQDGQVVLSRLDGDLLRAVAGATPGGRYVPWATGDADLGRLYREMIAAAPGRLIESEPLQLVTERFQIFLAIALVLFAVVVLVPERLALPAVRIPRVRLRAPGSKPPPVGAGDRAAGRLSRGRPAVARPAGGGSCAARSGRIMTRAAARHPRDGCRSAPPRRLTRPYRPTPDTCSSTSVGSRVTGWPCRLCLLAIVAWLGAGGSAATIGQPERAFRNAMQAYRGGDYRTAAEAFANAADLRPGNAKLLYNAGAAAYRQGDLDGARRLLQESIDNGASAQLAAAGHLALGHTWMAEAEQLAETGPGAALPALEGAIERYERTLRMAPAHQAAAYHLEQARAWLDELRRQQQQQQAQSQEQSQGEQEQRPEPDGEQEQPAPAPQSQDQEQQPQQPESGAEQPEAAQSPATTAEGRPTDQDAADVARQIIAAEEALATLLDRRRRQLEPVARDW